MGGWAREALAASAEGRLEASAALEGLVVEEVSECLPFQAFRRLQRSRPQVSPLVDSRLARLGSLPDAPLYDFLEERFRLHFKTGGVIMVVTITMTTTAEKTF